MFITSNQAGGKLQQGNETVQKNEKTTEYPYYIITGCKLDNLVNVFDLQNQLCNILEAIVYEKDSALTKRQKEDLMSLFLVFGGGTNPSFRQKIEKMLKLLLDSCQNLLDNKYDKDTEEYEDLEPRNEPEIIQELIEELSSLEARAYLYEKGNVYKVRFVDRIRDNEMNLMQYYAEQQKVLIKRARIEQSLQVFRKYKIGWIAFMKGNKIQGLENKKQVLESSRLICLT